MMPLWPMWAAAILLIAASVGLLIEMFGRAIPKRTVHEFRVPSPTRSYTIREGSGVCCQHAVSVGYQRALCAECQKEQP